MKAHIHHTKESLPKKEFEKLINHLPSGDYVLAEGLRIEATSSPGTVIFGKVESQNELTTLGDAMRFLPEKISFVKVQVREMLAMQVSSVLQSMPSDAFIKIPELKMSIRKRGKTSVSVTKEEVVSFGVLGSRLLEAHYSCNKLSL